MGIQSPVGLKHAWEQYLNFHSRSTNAQKTNSQNQRLLASTNSGNDLWLELLLAFQLPILEAVGIEKGHDEAWNLKVAWLIHRSCILQGLKHFNPTNSPPTSGFQDSRFHNVSRFDKVDIDTDACKGSRKRNLELFSQSENSANGSKHIEQIKKMSALQSVILWLCPSTFPRTRYHCWALASTHHKLSTYIITTGWLRSSIGRHLSGLLLDKSKHLLNWPGCQRQCGSWHSLCSHSHH